MGQRGADGHGHVLLFGQLVGDQVALGDVLQRDAHAELMGDAQRGEDIVGLVGVGLQRDGAVQHRQQGLPFLVVGRQLGGVAVRRLFAGGVVLCRRQRAAQDGGGGHAGRVALVFIHPLGVLAEGTLHRRRVFDDHVVHPVAHGFHGQEGAAQYVGAARPGADAGDAGIAGRRQAGVAGLMPSMARSWGEQMSFISL